MNSLPNTSAGVDKRHSRRGSSARSTEAHNRRWADLVAALPWITPALIMIFGVVLFPAGLMFYNSTRVISRSGLDKGTAGFGNFAQIFAFPDFGPIVVRTFVWVILVVVLTVLISLALAQLLYKEFPGRRLVRLAVIVPWAASVVMTTLVVYFGLEPYFGIFNKLFIDLGIIHDPAGFGWTKQPETAFLWAIAVAVFVSLPFTTYTILAGLQTVSVDTLEAAKMDGARPARIYVNITLPQLRGAISIAILINIINVFNSLPILRTMTNSIPGYDADTIMTMIFKYIQVQGRVDYASALSVIAFIIVLIVVALYVRVVKPMKEV